MSNLLYGLRPHGRFIHAANIMDDGSNVTPDDLIGYLPEVYDVIAYNADGTKLQSSAREAKERPLIK